jgi:hypothetical protein
MQHFTILLLQFTFSLLVKRVFFLLNAAYAIARVCVRVRACVQMYNERNVD